MDFAVNAGIFLLFQTMGWTGLHQVLKDTAWWGKFLEGERLGFGARFAILANLMASLAAIVYSVFVAIAQPFVFH